MAQTLAKIFVIFFLSLYLIVILGWVAWTIRRRERASARRGPALRFMQRLVQLFSLNRPHDAR